MALNYWEKIALFDLTNMKSMVDLIASGAEIVRINNGCSLEKEFSELICMNLQMVIIPNY